VHYLDEPGGSGIGGASSAMSGGIERKGQRDYCAEEIGSWGVVSSQPRIRDIGACYLCNAGRCKRPNRRR
jgi:hypothetical protein